MRTTLKATLALGIIALMASGCDRNSTPSTPSPSAVLAEAGPDANDVVVVGQPISQPVRPVATAANATPRLSDAFSTHNRSASLPRTTRLDNSGRSAPERSGSKAPVGPWTANKLPSRDFGSIVKAVNQIAGQMPESESKAFQAAVKIVMLDRLDQMVQGAKTAPSDEVIEAAMTEHLAGRTPWDILVEAKNIEDEDVRNRQASPLN